MFIFYHYVNEPQILKSTLIKLNKNYSPHFQKFCFSQKFVSRLCPISYNKKNIIIINSYFMFF